jgi:hypothetical protein
MNPAFQVAKGTAPSVGGNNQAQWMDIKGNDGQLHRIYIDPARDGGRASFASMYLRSGVVGGDPDDPNRAGFHQHNLYLDGTKPLQSEIEQAGQLATKWGTIPPGTQYATLRVFQWGGVPKAQPVKAQ